MLALFAIQRNGELETWSPKQLVRNEIKTKPLASTSMPEYINVARRPKFVRHLEYYVIDNIKLCKEQFSNDCPESKLLPLPCVGTPLIAIGSKAITEKRHQDRKGNKCSIIFKLK